nr:hypothetical protein HMPREF0276_1227 [Corynebacterium accolens ATCC 49725]
MPRESVRKVGPATRKVIEELIAAKAISAEGVRKFVCEALI